MRYSAMIHYARSSAGAGAGAGARAGGTCDRRYHGARGAVRPGAVAPRAAGSGLLNERALLQMADVLYRRVCSSLPTGRFPFV